MARLSRRRLLAGLGAAATVSVAGCLGSEDAAGRLSLPVVTVPGLETPGASDGTVPDRPAGEPALLDFFATWCAPCVPQMAELRSIRGEYPDLHLVSVTQEHDEAAIRSFWQDHDGSWPVARDPDLRATDRYDIRGLPTAVIVGADGNEQFRHQGLVEADRLRTQIEDLDSV